MYMYNHGSQGSETHYVLDAESQCCIPIQAFSIPTDDAASTGIGHKRRGEEGWEDLVYNA